VARAFLVAYGRTAFRRHFVAQGLPPSECTVEAAAERHLGAVGDLEALALAARAYHEMLMGLRSDPCFWENLDTRVTFQNVLLLSHALMDMAEACRRVGEGPTADRLLRLLRSDLVEFENAYHIYRLGTMLGASGLGALVGSVVLTPVAQGLRRTGVVLAAATLWTGAWLIIFAASTWLPLALASIFLTSLTIPVVLTTAHGLMQVLAPPDMRGRLLTTLLMVSFGVLPLAAVVTGFAADLVGPPMVLGVNGGLLMVAGLLMLSLRPGLRTWEADARVTDRPLGPTGGPSGAGSR
jgi:hypothetical protein